VSPGEPKVSAPVARIVDIAVAISALSGSGKTMRAA
jgi:hypothetical protein